MRNFTVASAIFVIASVISTGCAPAKFTVAENGKYAEDGSATTAETSNKTEAAVTPPYGETRLSKCLSITVPHFPDTFQHASLDPRTNKQPEKIALRFERPDIIAWMDRADNSTRSIVFTYHKVNQFSNVSPDAIFQGDNQSWDRSRPTHHEISCYLSKTASRKSHPKMVELGYGQASFYESDHYISDGKSIRLLSIMGSNGYQLHCHKNTHDINGKPDPLTLDKINKTLCGVATVYVPGK